MSIRKGPGQVLMGPPQPRPKTQRNIPQPPPRTVRHCCCHRRTCAADADTRPEEKK